MTFTTKEDFNLVPWRTRTTTPDAVRDLPKPPAGPEVSDAKTLEYRLWAIEQAEIARQQEIENRIDPTLTADEVKSLYELELAKENERTFSQRQFSNARTFLAENPQYIPDPSNAKKMEKYLEAAGLDGTSVDHYHQAFSELAAAGAIRVRQAPLPAPRREVTAQDLYSMPLEDLKRLAEFDGDQSQTRIVGTRRPR
jgi:hypothetical protein